MSALLGQVDCFRVARGPGTIAIADSFRAPEPARPKLNTIV